MLDLGNPLRCFFTQQVFLIGTRNEDGIAHFAPISWISYTYGEPPCLVVSMKIKKKTFENIRRSGLFSATVLTPDLLTFAECRNNATRNENLYQKVCPELESGKALDVPLISGAKWSYECEVIKTVEFGESVTFFAQIRHINIAAELMNLNWFDLKVINPVVYSPGNYFTIGEHLGKIGDFSKESVRAEQKQDILCRKATADDIEKIVQIDLTLKREQICKAVLQEECYIAEDGDQIIGFAIMSFSFFNYGFIELLIIAEEHRRRGMGAALLDYLFWQCKTEKLFTSTNESNTPMRELLAKSGFIPCGQIDALDEGDPELFFVRKKAAR